MWGILGTPHQCPVPHSTIHLMISTSRPLGHDVRWKKHTLTEKQLFILPELKLSFVVVPWWFLKPIHIYIYQLPFFCKVGLSPYQMELFGKLEIQFLLEKQDKCLIFSFNWPVVKVELVQQSPQMVTNIYLYIFAFFLEHSYRLMDFHRFNDSYEHCSFWCLNCHIFDQLEPQQAGCYVIWYDPNNPWKFFAHHLVPLPPLQMRNQVFLIGSRLFYGGQRY